MKKIYYYLYAQYCIIFKRNISTATECLNRGLKHQCNIHGDVREYIKACSIWNDEYGNQYYCDEVL